MTAKTVESYVSLTVACIRNLTVFKFFSETEVQYLLVLFVSSPISIVPFEVTDKSVLWSYPVAQ